MVLLLSLICFNKKIKVLLFIHMNYIICFMSAAEKVMPPIYWCWPTMSDMDVGDMVVEVAPFHPYPVGFCCCVTDGRGTVTEWCLAWNCVPWKRGSFNSSTGEKMAPTDIHCCLMNVYGDQTVGMSTVRWWWCDSAVAAATVFTSVGADCYEHSMQALVHHW